MPSLIDTILSAVPSSVVGNLAQNFGETPAATSSALGGVVPAILGGLLSKGESGGLGSIASLVQGALAGGNPLDAIAGGAAPVAAAEGSGLASSVFGSSLGAVTSALAAKFGVAGSTISGLLSFAGPLIAGAIGKALGGNVTANGLQQLVTSERSSILSALPAGLGSLLGLGGVGGAAASAANYAGDTMEAAGSGIGKWLPWLLGALVLLALIFGLSKCNSNPTPVADNTTTTTTEITNTSVPEPAATDIPVGAGVRSETRDGKPAVIVYFDTGKAEVVPAFGPAAGALKDYLAANPGSKLAVSGFNDPTGNAAANAKLSKDRAEAVGAALVAAGVAKESYELVKPADSTDNSTSNANARRVEVVVK